ncbi:hypothetical protein EDB85DRAFT_1892658 [Lactarius pseudohatsudake]|nr:hypothetical protein EDB85DRAFT_1892658 [Lactarius pseudohatsudake]
MRHDDIDALTLVRLCDVLCSATQPELDVPAKAVFRSRRTLVEHTRYIVLPMTEEASVPSHLLVENHLIETRHDEHTLRNQRGRDTADEPEIIEVPRVHAKGQAVALVGHLMREEEEPLAGDCRHSQARPRLRTLTMSRLRRSSGRRCMITTKLASKTRGARMCRVDVMRISEPDGSRPSTVISGAETEVQFSRAALLLPSEGQANADMEREQREYAPTDWGSFEYPCGLYQSSNTARVGEPLPAATGVGAGRELEPAAS